jgi:large subunit ribosomal protein L20
MRARSGKIAHTKRVKIRKLTKGMSRPRRTSYRQGKQGVIRSFQYAYRDRRNKKRDFKKLWITRINAAARAEGTTYSALVNNLKQANIVINRKVLAEIAYNDPAAFKEIVKAATTK